MVSIKTDQQNQVTAEQPEGQQEAKEEIPAEPYQLSADQKRVLGMLGYPDQFIIIFDEGNHNKRIDNWMYESLEVCFIFQNGICSNSSQFMVGELTESNYHLKPQDFNYMMKPSEIETLVGSQGSESIEELTGLKVLTFGQGELICIFNEQEGLIGVSNNKKASTQT